MIEFGLQLVIGRRLQDRNEASREIMQWCPESRPWDRLRPLDELAQPGLGLLQVFYVCVPALCCAASACAFARPLGASTYTANQSQKDAKTVRGCNLHIEHDHSNRDCQDLLAVGRYSHGKRLREGMGSQ